MTATRGGLTCKGRLEESGHFHAHSLFTWYLYLRLFFRRHYPLNTVTFCDLDPQERK